MKIKKRIFSFAIYSCTFILSLSFIFLPWKIRVIFLKVLGFTAGILLSFRFIQEYINNRAFAQESERDLLLQRL